MICIHLRTSTNTMAIGSLKVIGYQGRGIEEENLAAIIVPKVGRSVGGRKK